MWAMLAPKNNNIAVVDTNDDDNAVLIHREILFVRTIWEIIAFEWIPSNCMLKRQTYPNQVLKYLSSGNGEQSQSVLDREPHVRCLYPLRPMNRS